MKKLFVQEPDGTYTPAEPATVCKAAREFSSRKLRRNSEFVLGSAEAKEVIGAQYLGLEHESFGVLFLDTAHRVLEFKHMFRGTVNASTVYPREIVKAALRLNASKVILAHNHPSGANRPSEHDKHLTERLQDTLKLVDVVVLDHLIVGDDVISMADLGEL